MDAPKPATRNIPLANPRAGHHGTFTPSWKSRGGRIVDVHEWPDQGVARGVVIAPERHVLYAYSPKHDGATVDRILGGYAGYLVADAHAVYDHLYKTGKVIEVACWAHCRRCFYKAIETDPERARQALALIGALFAIERGVADAPPGKRKAVRLRESKPVLARFFEWCSADGERVLDDTPIAKGIGYAKNQRGALERFLEDPRLPLHNNGSELSLRREVVGRKNWLFVGSDDAGSVNAAFVSLLASCQLHGIEPSGYLRDLLCLLPSWPIQRVLELAPLHWNETREHEDTQQRLAANVFRRVSLGPGRTSRPEVARRDRPVTTRVIERTQRSQPWRILQSIWAAGRYCTVTLMTRGYPEVPPASHRLVAALFHMMTIERPASLAAVASESIFLMWSVVPPKRHVPDPAEQSEVIGALVKFRYTFAVPVPLG